MLAGGTAGAGAAHMARKEGPAVQNAAAITATAVVTGALGGAISEAVQNDIIERHTAEIKRLEGTPETHPKDDESLWTEEHPQRTNGHTEDRFKADPTSRSRE